MIEINNLSYRYRKKTEVIDNLSLHLSDSGIIGLFGKNGAGKTTLLKLLSGLLFPKQGKLNVKGFTPGDRKPAFLADLYYLPEEIFVPPVTTGVYEMLLRKFYPKFSTEIYDTLLKHFKIPAYTPLNKLSYGQKKKAMIAFGIATQSSIMIFDEPTNGLDIPSKTEFRQLLANYYSEDRLFIISTHQVLDLQNMLDQIIVLDEGKILFNQSMQAITSKLQFVKLADKNEYDSCIHYETQFGNVIGVKRNVNEQETEVNIEVLFNAILAQSMKINSIFNSEV